MLSTNGSGHSNLLVNQTFKSGSHEGRYLYQQGRSSLFSFVYTCILVIFIDDTPPNLLLSQAMANRILGCLPSITYRGGVSIFERCLLIVNEWQRMKTIFSLSNRLLRAAPMKDVISTSKADHPSFSFVYTCRCFTE